ncbi:TPA: type IV pilin protein, partial [Neisseria subflava]
MYLKAFGGKRNGATVQRGYSLVQLLVVMLLVSILATAAFTAYRESVRSANLRAAHAALLENARFMEQFYTKKGSFKLTSTKWPELPVKEAGGFCIRMSGQAKGILEGKFTLKAVALD